MSVEIFSRERFEAALPRNKWKSCGVKDGQFTYLVYFGNPHCFIRVASSVAPSGLSRDTGEDSIRVWLVGSVEPINVVGDLPEDPDSLIVIGAKNQRWVTRVPGWDKRLNNVLNKIATVGKWIKPCAICNNLLRLGKSKKYEGLFTLSCWAKDAQGNFCNHVPMSLLDVDGKKVVPPTITTTGYGSCPVCSVGLRRVEIRKGSNAGKFALTCPARDEDGNFLNHCFEVEKK